ncbi:hypothetical protein TOT_010000001 [Theileria orientalis strain Shintoku]|uniref:Uncharacterized protein n=1 Tax=Theileria orientalis strain Shintoku TaxID=869250 RepID=J7MBR2_THEOR|nr:hypothetical protein TOT_010000001 [Theileria orientalis strain Shintoku]BAM38532.1 hypothetical protein TOT_010000001 [Theileria orientalis strain Shintoku]|eukprot:XP_009688833.1 hypothetical protein TOT_010000001 [Theileria orientalis strain Shintoku]
MQKPCQHHAEHTDITPLVYQTLRYHAETMSTPYLTHQYHTEYTHNHIQRADMTRTS